MPYLPYTAGISATAIDGTHLQLTQAGGQTTTVTGAFSIDYNYIVSADGSNNTQVTLPFAGKTFFVSNEAQLNQAILDLTVAPAGAFTIELMNNITEGSYGSDVLTTPTGGSVTAPLDPFAISLPNPTATLTIDGSNVSGVNYAVDGTRQYRGLLVYSGHVVLQNLIIQNAKAQGGAGGSGLVGGGGGAGLGGGLFVSTGSQVTISNVTFSNDRATGGDGGTGFGGAVGGAGGGGGLGGAGGSLTAQNPKLTPISGSGTGTGKTHRAIAIARACIRSPSVGYPLSNLATWRSANFGRAKFDWLRYTNARPMGKR